jgi:hypothetical protein
MSQLILYQGDFGIVLATDSRAVQFTQSGEPHYFTLSKLYALNATTVLATVGAGYGQQLCEAFQQRIRQLPRARGEDITELAFHFFREGLQARTPQSFGHRDPEIQRVYFVIAGAITENAGAPPGFVVYASDHATDPLHSLATGHFVCIPRQLSLETRLQQLAVDQTSWEQVEEYCTRFLQRMAVASEDIGPPFLLTRVSGDGIKTRFVEMEPGIKV